MQNRLFLPNPTFIENHQTLESNDWAFGKQLKLLP